MRVDRYDNPEDGVFESVCGNFYVHIENYEELEQSRDRWKAEALAARAYIDCDKKHGDGTEARVLPWLELRVLYDEARAANEEMEK